jgi:hypothetical protein
MSQNAPAISANNNNPAISLKGCFGIASNLRWPKAPVQQLSIGVTSPLHSLTLGLSFEVFPKISGCQLKHNQPAGRAALGA